MLPSEHFPKTSLTQKVLLVTFISFEDIISNPILSFLECKVFCKGFFSMFSMLCETNSIKSHSVLTIFLLLVLFVIRLLYVFLFFLQVCILFMMTIGCCIRRGNMFVLSLFLLQLRLGLWPLLLLFRFRRRMWLVHVRYFTNYYDESVLLSTHISLTILPKCNVAHQI